MALPAQVSSCGGICAENWKKKKTAIMPRSYHLDACHQNPNRLTPRRKIITTSHASLCSHNGLLLLLLSRSMTFNPRFRTRFLKSWQDQCPPPRLNLSRSVKLTNEHPIFLKKSHFKISSAVARFSTVTVKHWLKKTFNSLDKRSGFLRVGVPFVVIKKSAFNGSSFR